VRSSATQLVYPGDAAVIIHPSALPSGVGIGITAAFPAKGEYWATFGLVLASQRCTGS